ncbi:hypothetical protein CHU92_04370 [Flavobacterium cyanobacteriorum]|uniref:SnoaL-like domain-containing protein n=1 Tax=Flavobacterium cyanobacteriorum TaxID=2022802 RepID=A0A255ZKX5_9FLAO|nr:nuclear transport factor 2 family protein [Flavobacterium cyanobacteriorum]OYQ41525.1 hypothetical protein CHU92_04370 [Flavobacterium cyanobacteriorum]
MSPKELVKEYYATEAFRSPEATKRFFDENLELKWHSSKGYLELDRNDILALAEEMHKSYLSSRAHISHIFAEGNMVTVRYTQYVNTIENPAEEMLLAHFVAIWEVKGNRIYKGYLMSQLG